MKNLLTIITTFIIGTTGWNQCGPTVPNYVIDLTGSPDTTWVLYEADALDRQGQCCGAPTNYNCISFDITLDPNAAGIFFDYDGAGAFGSLNWQIDCGTPYSLKDTICVTDLSFTLTFCKPGSDNGNYTLISVSKPTFPGDQTVPMNCTQPVEALGVTAASITWTSISPGPPGAYDYLLDCTNCLMPTFTPDPTGPTYVEYQVCGYPILDYCVGTFTYCDTVSFTVQDSLQVFTSPSNATFCSGGSAIINANATGGDGNYSFYWYNSSMTQVGTGPVFVTSTAGTYTVEVRDGNYEPGACADFFKTFNVTAVNPPVVDAGIDQVLCADDPEADLSGTVQNATGGIWSGGTGVYLPSNTSLAMTYVPTTTEISNGSVTLTLTSTGAGGGCINNSDDVILFFVDTIQTDLSDLSLNCNDDDILINPTVTGGLPPISYLWSDGSTGTSTSLGGGTHCLDLIDANGCTATDCFTITVPTALTLSVSSTPATTNGGSDGTATATPGGGTPPYTYLWNTTGTNQTETGLSYGIYTVTVTDANGCQISGSVVVNEPACNGFFVNTSATPANCFGDSTGTASVTVFGGTSPFNYSWNDYANQTTSTAVNLPAGIYEVIVTDDNGCLAYGLVAVNEPDVLDNTFTHNDVTTQGGSDGSAQANVTGGTGAYTYLWSTTDVTQGISGIPYGWYSVDITDGNGCILVDSLYISQPPCNQFDIFVSATLVSCNGGSDGTATLNIVQGTGPYSISWSTGASDVTFVDNLSAGVYTVDVTDAQNCYAFTTFGIAEPSALTAGLLTTPPTCNGSNNGTIDMTVTGGTAPYSFLWNSGSTNEDRINLSPGTYSVVVTDGNGCTANSSTTITEPDVLQVAYTVQHVTCFEGTDGSIDVTIVGGTPVYSYSWSNGDTSQDLSGLDVGGYILNLTDGNSCSPSSPITILVNEPLQVLADTITVDCPLPGEQFALVSVVPEGGNPNYAISYDNGVTYLSYGDYSEMQPVDNSYQIVIQDINGCLSPVYDVDIDTNVIAADIDFNLCYYSGQSTEVVSVTPGGGTPDYSISTDGGTSFNPVLSYDITVGINNTYNIVVQDANGCISETYSILLPDTMSVDVSVGTDYNGADITCFGLSDGSATSVVTGGTGPYTYLWSNGGTASTITGLNAGTYLLTVTDDNGCQVSGNTTLVNPPLLISVTSVTSDYNGEDISCNGLNTGSANVVPSGGVGPYTYSWSNGQTSQSATGLIAGTYFVTVTDANECTTDNSVFLTEPDTLDIQTTITDVSCNGGNDGAIDITVTGGVTPYAYQWSNGPTTEDVTDLPAGTYMVTLTDANGCIYQLNEIIVDPTAIDLDLTMTDALCKGDSTGSADLSAIGGTPPYTFLWNTGAITEDISGLAAGSYAVTVTDDNGCWTVIAGTVYEPDTITVSAIISDALCFGYTDGSVSVTVGGGTVPYSYVWSDGQTTSVLNNAGVGVYQLTVTDNNGCEFIESFVVNHPDSLWAFIDAPLNFHDHHISYYGGNDGMIDLSVSGGTLPYSYLWSDGQTSEDLTNLTAGYYEVLIEDNQGCTYSIGVELLEPYDLEAPTAMSPNQDGKNDAYYVRGLEAYPDNKFIVTNRWGNIVYEEENYNNDWKGVNENGDELPEGVYYVIIEINGEEALKTFVELRRK